MLFMLGNYCTCTVDFNYAELSLRERRNVSDGWADAICARLWWCATFCSIKPCAIEICHLSKYRNTYIATYYVYLYPRITYHILSTYALSKILKVVAYSYVENRAFSKWPILELSIWWFGLTRYVVQSYMTFRPYAIYIYPVTT